MTPGKPTHPMHMGSLVGMKMSHPIKSRVLAIKPTNLVFQSKVKSQANVLYSCI